ncbi:unnamed protein product [Schistosoma rodhaini]|uniref:BolA-like protein n=1 Tax=Schistosoma rodhaini TaxID=6188 RepID=A0AA85F3M6_9TREM|nr:unnamed protein product [Schistosoma rodhaini]
MFNGIDDQDLNLCVLEISLDLGFRDQFPLSSYFGIVLDNCFITPKRQLTTGEYVVRTRRYMSSSAGPVESRLNRVLSQKFDPTFLRIYNESHRHNQKIGIETHFRVVIVSHHFNNLSPVQRERLVYKSVEHELQSGVHALSVISN